MKLQITICVFILFNTICFAQKGVKLYSNYKDIAQNIPLEATTKFQTSQPKDIKPAIPLNFYTTHLPFFCKAEFRMQKSNVPLTFRIGNIDDCNKLEQKPGY